MNFTAKFNGPNPPFQDQTVLFADCDTGLDSPDAPTNLTIASGAAWLAAVRVAPTVVRVSVNNAGIAIGTYNANVDVTIPDLETCEIGRKFTIPVTLTVAKGKLKFR